MAFDSADGYAVLSGGCSSTGTGTDTWIFTGGIWTQLYVRGPPAREYPAMTYDPHDRCVVLFGGDVAGVAVNDTWTFSGGNWTKVTASPEPPARTRAMMTFDEVDDYVLLTGGLNTSSYKDATDTWAFSNMSWTEISPTNGTKPPGRDTGSMTYDAAESEVLLFGGFSQSRLVVVNDTWSYRAGEWTDRSKGALAPSPREGAAFCYDPDLGLPVLFGGDTNFAPLRELWEYNGSVWTAAHLANAPSARSGIGMIWDQPDDYVMLFGGNQSAPATAGWPVSDTFSLGPNFTTSFAAEPGTIELGQSTVLNARSVATGSPSLAYLYEGLPPGCVGDSSSPVPCTPNRTGAYTISVNVTASWGSESSWSHSTTILSVNHEPAVVRMSVFPSAITYNEGISVNVSVTNGTGPKTYSYTGLPPGCASANVSHFTCFPFGSVPGGYPHTFEINASIVDVLGGRNSSTARVLVNPDPTIEPAGFVILPGSTDVGRPVNLTVEAGGGTGPLTYDYSGLPPGCGSENRSTMTCTPAQIGDFRIQLEVTDSTGYPSPEATAWLNVSAAPSVEGFEFTPSELDVGQEAFAVANVSGGTGALQLGYSGLPRGCDASGNPEFLCYPSSSGRFTVTVRAVDDVGGNASRTAILMVHPDPVVVGFTASSPGIDVGQSFTLTAQVAGGWGPLNYSYSGLPPGCPDLNLSVLTCPAGGTATPGVYTIHVTVVDRAGAYSSGSTEIRISPRPQVNSVLVSPSDPTTGTPLSLELRTSGGTPPLTFTYLGLPDGCVSANSPALHCTPERAGTYAVGVEVIDGAGLSAFENESIYIRGIPPVPSNPPVGFSGSLDGSALLIAAATVAASAAIIMALLARRRAARRSELPGPPEPESVPEGAPAEWIDPIPDEEQESSSRLV